MAEPIVLHITNAPTPYRLPQYRAFQKELQTEGIRLHVHFLGGRSRQREWKFRDEDFVELSWSMGNSATMAQSAVDRIHQLRPAVVVLAWAMDGIALRLLLHCRRRHIPVMIYSGETEISARRRYQWARNLFRIPFYKLATGFIAYGTAAQRYLTERGVPLPNIEIAINVVDTHFFSDQVDAIISSPERAQLRSQFQLPSGKPFAAHLLFVGYVLRWKGIIEMVQAVALLNRTDVALHIVGTGEDEAVLRQTVAQLGLQGQVFMHGYQQKNELPRYYAMADLLLFPSLNEVFGLVMVEGAAAGLPLIATRFAGATEDVIKHGVTGIIVDPSNSAEFSSALHRLLDSPQLRREMGRAARHHALTKLTPERSAEGYRRGVARAISVQRRREK